MTEKIEQILNQPSVEEKQKKEGTIGTTIHSVREGRNLPFTNGKLMKILGELTDMKEDQMITILDAISTYYTNVRVASIAKSLDRIGNEDVKDEGYKAFATAISALNKIPRSIRNICAMNPGGY